MARKPKETVKAAIEAAAATDASEMNDARRAGPDFIRKRFKLLETGLHLVKGDDQPLQWICDKFEIESETRDEDGNWGFLITWRDRDGAPRSDIFGRELFAGDCREVRLRLAAGGLAFSGDTRSRQHLVEYLNIARSPARALCVDRTGWHVIEGRRVFVLPDRTIGEVRDKIILRNAGKDRAPFGRRGTLASWKDSIGRLSNGNSRLIFCISAAFAGSLLDLADEDGGGFNLKGSSRLGKTTALRVAASVWGGDAEQGASAFIRSWRATGNGLESVAVLHSDTLLPLDEMGQVDASEIGDIAYMIANGSGKARATRDGGARAPARWRVLFLSTGEMGLADKNAEARKVTKAGQEQRLIDIAADAGAGFGLFEELHCDETADKFVDALKDAGRANYGTAGVAFLEWLLSEIDRDPEFIFAIRACVDNMVNRWLEGLDAAGGQVRSVARRFALVATAGAMATSANITGWQKAASENAAKSLFESWLSERGTMGASEDRQAIRQLSAYIGRFGGGRFDLWATLRAGQQAEIEDDDTPPNERVRTLVRAGWRKYDRQSGTIAYTYYLTDDAMHEAMAGLDFRSAVKTLCEAKMILRDSQGKSTTPAKPPGVGKTIRLYVVPGHVIGADEGASPGD